MKNPKSMLDSKRKRQRDSGKVVGHRTQADESDANHEMRRHETLKKKSKLALKRKGKGDKIKVVDSSNKAQMSHKDELKKIENEIFPHKPNAGSQSLEKKKSKLALKTRKRKEMGGVDSENNDQIHADEHADDEMHVGGGPKSDHAKRSKQTHKLSEDGTSNELNEVTDGTKIRTKKAKKEMKCSKKDFSANKERMLGETPAQADEEKDGISSVEEACSREMKKKAKKGMKHKRKDFHVDEARAIEEVVVQVDEEKVDEISSVDEDCSRGMKKWLIKYRESRQDVNVLQQRIDDFIVAHEEQLEQGRKEREARVAEGGWTVVVHHKGRKKTTETETGVTVGSVSQAAVVDNMGKKKNKEAHIDFYRFQKREAKRNEVMMLQSKFEQDKKRIQQLRASRKFRPY